jgi:ABC-2 type transport system permease protein
MKKFLHVLIKNFKVLFRAKTSFLAVVLGPLLIIGLIGFAFNSSSNIDLSIGYHAPDQSPLTVDIVSSLENTTSLQSFTSEEFCTNQLKLGLLHTCIIFPENFVIENGKTNNITYIVDKSRVNLVYTVIEEVSETVGVKSEELSRGLTEELLNTLTTTQTSIDSNLVSLIKLKRSVDSASADAQVISDDLGKIDLSYTSVNVPETGDISTLSGYTESIKDKALNARGDILDAVEDIRADVGSNSSIETELASIESELESLNKTAIERYNESEALTATLLASLAGASDALDDIEEKLDNANSLTANSRQKIATLRESMTAINTEVDTIQTTLEATVTDINSIEVTSSDQIVNPINTNIETISSEANQLTILFPYVIVLVIMFVGLMLSSTLVMVEKKSRASFRVFTTPTKDEFFITTTFFTAFIIVALQVTLILLATKFFLVDIITQNMLVNIVLLVLAISIFIMIGMAIGYLLNNQQGANMASISIGAIFLFFSNIMLPLETLPPTVQKIASLSPYVLASETLRRSILFGLDFTQIIIDLAILLGYTVVVILLIVLFQKIAKTRFFKRNPHVKETKKQKQYNVLWLGNKKIEDEKELVSLIQKIDDKDFQELLSKHHKTMKKFLFKKLGRKQRWIRKLKKLTREEFILEFAKSNKKLIDDLQVKRSDSIKKALQDTKEDSE